VRDHLGRTSFHEPEKTPLNSFKEIFEYYFELSYKTLKGPLIDFGNEFIRHNHFEEYFISINRDQLIEGHGRYVVVYRAKDFNNEIFAVKKIKSFKTYENEKIMNLFGKNWEHLLS
jgi:hypothetical protein